MDAKAAAQRWADIWARAWPRRDAEAIAALYADTVAYRSPAFRPPDLGLAGVHRYLSEQPPAEENIECWFGQPIVSGDRAAVEWWASWTEKARTSPTLASGCSGRRAGYASDDLAGRASTNANGPDSSGARS